MPPAPPPRVYETVLYAEDLVTAGAFYREVLGLALVDDRTPTALAFRLASGALLLVFDPQESERPGRPAPSHGARGPGHVAFGVDPGQLSAWRERLHGQGVALEESPLGTASGRQLYFRDPAGNSIELVEGDLWP